MTNLEPESNATLPKQAIANRTLLRKKVLQCVFEKESNSTSKIDKAVKDLNYSIQQTYSLYNYLLLLIVQETSYIERKIDNAKHKNLPTEEDLNPNTKFIDNKFVSLLRKNLDLNDYIEEHKFSWTTNYPEILKDMYEFIVKQEYYNEYMQNKASAFDEDKEIWRKLIRDYVAESEKFEEALEDYSIFWNDDLDVVLSFVMKTIRRFSEDEGMTQKLIPLYKDDEDKAFGEKLLKTTLLNIDENTETIDNNIKGWNIDRIALMDKIILQIAISEMINFINIPIEVTINEYIELAKSYSSEKSPSFINGILDKIAKELKKEGRITKVRVVRKNS